MASVLQFALLMIFPAMVVVGALRDLTSFTIPNWISAVLILGFLPAALAGGFSLEAFGGHLLVGFLALVAGMGMFALRWIGGGDAKLFAAAALWLGPAAVLPYVLFTACAGGALAMALLSLRSPLFRPYVMAGPAWFGRLADPGENVPYGVAIAAGALFAFPASALMQAWGGLAGI